MGGVIPFPFTPSGRHGVIHVMGDRINGFEVAHESASGNSWGSFSTHTTGEAAITAAFALNRDTYSGACEVFIGDGARQDAFRNVGLASIPGEA